MSGLSWQLGNARLVDPASGLDSIGGVRVEDGRIAAIGPDLSEPSAGGIDAGGLVLAPGLVDLCVRTGEPGALHKETLASAGRAAACGGVTSMVVMPDTDPVIDAAALVEFILGRARDTSLVRVFPAASLTRGMAGQRMSEIGLLKRSGAVVFADGGHCIEDSGLLYRAFQYAASFAAPVMTCPDVPAMTRAADMDACAFADRLGLRGAPAGAEWIGLGRDMILAEMTGVRLITDRVSTARALTEIRRNRAKMPELACTVSAAHLFFNALDIGDYRTHAKLFPPLRSEDDRQALLAGFAAGEIDAIVSAHQPQPPEDKRLPFAQAAFGAVGLETLLASVLGSAREAGIGLLDALAPLTYRPADLLGLPGGRLAIGAPADMILLAPDQPWICRNEQLCSRSQNSPYDKRCLQGRVIKTIVGGKTIFSRDKNSQNR